jgi:serine/threonine-protein kinase
VFRRDYTVHVANSGAEALRTIEAHDIDVVISDQRMPEMTGVEVLTEIKRRSPATRRILLTGYADLAAVEASINEAEVFKYLMKPCPADQVRSAVTGALALEQNPSVVERAPQALPKSSDPRRRQVPNVAVVAPRKKVSALPAAVHLLVLSNDEALVAGVQAACPNQTCHQAQELNDAVKLLSRHPVGVLITDLATSETEVLKISATVREVVPEMVIVLASDRSDANVLIQLINSGQVFRFLLKPLQAGQCRIWLSSALRRFAERGNRDRLATPGDDAMPGWFTRFKNWFLGVEG